jgi:hypothetical protein
MDGRLSPFWHDTQDARKCMSDQRPKRGWRALRVAIITIVLAASRVEARSDGPNPAPKKAPGAQPITPAAASLSGHVTNESDKPIADVRIEVEVTKLNGITRQFLAKSTASGDYRVEIPRLEAGNSFYILATHPGYQRLLRVSLGADSTLPILKPGGQLKVNLSLHAALYVAGTVVDEQGKPIPGARISPEAVTASGRQFEFEETDTKPDGSFEIFAFPERPQKVEGEASRGCVSCSHPDFVTSTIPDVYTLTPRQRTALRIVLKNGHTLSGVVLDAANKPVPRVTVKAVEPGGRCLKAGMADERGKFVIRGMADGPATLTILAGHIKEKTRVPLVLAGDRTDLKISLQSIPFPKDLKTYRVLGMELADVTPELRSAYDLATDRGVLILACVKRTDPMQQPGEISPGCLLREVEIGSGNSVRDAIKSIIDLTDNVKPDDRLVVITYEVRNTVESDVFQSTTFKVTDSDLQELHDAAGQCAADDQAAILALGKLGAQLRFKAAKPAKPDSDVAGPEVELIILGDKWKGTDRDLRLVWYLPLSHFLVRGRGRVSDQALEELHKRRPEINVDRISEAYLGAGFESDLGSLKVAVVHANSPAARAGLAEKDVLVEFAGEPVSDFRTLRALTFTLKPGQKVAAKLQRHGKPVSVTIEMGSWD